jgi:hypothetical protein
VDVIWRFRFWIVPHKVGRWVWLLSMVWIGIGAAASGFIFISSTQPITASNIDGIPAWLGGPASTNVIVTGALVAMGAWLVLTIPVLVAGLRKLREPPWTGWWFLAWVAGLALMVLTRLWLDNLPQRTSCGTDGCGVVPYYGRAITNVRELAICGAFLALGAMMTLVLARPEAVSRRELEPGH